MRRYILFFLTILATSSPAQAAQFGAYAFPRNEQTPQQQAQDEGFCSQWASQQTGLNPALLQYKQEQAMEAQKQAYMQANRPTPIRKVGRGALTGLALGAMNDGMDSGGGKGAAMGATLMASRGLGDMAERKNQMALEQAANSNQSVQAETASYLRAYGACMEGKGYSIR